MPLRRRAGGGRSSPPGVCSPRPPPSLCGGQSSGPRREPGYPTHDDGAAPGTDLGKGGLMELFLNSIGFGLVTASILALAAVGLTLQFGMTNYVNFAYGDFMTLGAYLTWTLNVGLGWPFWPALFVGALLMAI